MVQESSYNRTLRDKLRPYDFKIDRIESHATTPGIADDAFVHRPTRHSGWIEVKESEVVPAKIKYRPRQALWLFSHCAAGGNAMTLIRIRKSKKVLIVPGSLSMAAERDLRQVMRDGFVSIIDDDNWGMIATSILKQCK